MGEHMHHSKNQQHYQTNNKNFAQVPSYISDKNKLMLLYETSRALQQSLDLNHNLEIGITAFQKAGFDRVRIYFYDEKKEIIYGRKCFGTEEQLFKKISIPIATHKKICKCIKLKKPVIKQTAKDSILKDILKKGNVKESISLPLVSKDKVVGVISLDNKFTKRNIPKELIGFLMVLANNLAMGIDNVRLYENNIQKLSYSTALYDVANTLNSTLDLDKVLNLVTIRIGKITRCTICSILLLDNDKQALIPTAVYTERAQYPWKGKKIEVEKSIGSYALNYKKPLLISNIQTDKRYIYKEFAREENLKTLFSLPLLAEQEAIGVVNMYFKHEKEVDEAEMNFLTALCNQAAMVIRNSKLYEVIEEDKEKLGGIIEIAHILNSKLETQELLKVLLDKTIAFTQAEHGSLLLVRGEQLEVIYSHHYTSDQMEKARLRLGEGLTGIVAKQGIPIIVDDVSKDKRYVETIKNIRSEADIPLIRKGKIIGVLNLESKQYANFRPYHKALEILKSIIAVAIENAQYYEEIKAFNFRLQKEVDAATHELIQKNRELQKMDHIKSDLISNVSHELRTPLTSIAGYTKLMLNQKAGQLTTVQQECLSIINTETDRLTRLINNLLDVSRLESGKIHFKTEEVNIEEIARHVIETLKPHILEKQINIGMIFPKKIPMIMGNKDLLNQVYTNLMSNALKFTQRGGRIVLGAKITGNELELYVHDNGSGIAPENIPKLFEKFYQVDSSMTREHSGTGLGLAIVKHIITAHHGKIWVESTVGKGTRFIFKLPIMK